MKKAEGCSEPFSNRPFCNHCCVAASSHSFVWLGVSDGGRGSMGRERSKNQGASAWLFTEVLGSSSDLASVFQ